MNLIQYGEVLVEDNLCNNWPGRALLRITSWAVVESKVSFTWLQMVTAGFFTEATGLNRLHTEFSFTFTIVPIGKLFYRVYKCKSSGLQLLKQDLSLTQCCL